MRTQTAAVDADFIFRVAEIDRPKERIAEIFGQVLNSLGLCAVVHPLVHDKELVSRDEKIDTLFSEGVIRQLSFDAAIFKLMVQKRHITVTWFLNCTGGSLEMSCRRMQMCLHIGSTGQV